MVNKDNALGRPPVARAGGSAAVLVLPGWNDDLKFYEKLCTEWNEQGLAAAIVPFPQAYAGYTRREHLRHVCQAFNKLIGITNPPSKSVGVLGFSYGGAYLAALLTARRPIMNLLLRAPACTAIRGGTCPKKNSTNT